MNKYQREAEARYYSAAMAAGLSYDAADAMRRDAQRLHGIAEQECNGTLYRCEEEGDTDQRGRPLKVGKVYQVAGMNGPGPLHYYITRDMETPARARIEATAASIGGTVEFQGDPRGWPVTVTLADGREISPPIRSR